MTINSYQLALITGGFIVVGVLVRILLKNYFSNQRIRQERISKVYKLLNEASHPIIEELKKCDITKPSILPAEFPQHEAAIRNFLGNLKDGSRSHTRLTEKWGMYKAKYNKGKVDGMFSPSLYVDPSGKSKPVFDEHKTLRIQQYNQELLDIVYDILKIAKKY